MGEYIYEKNYSNATCFETTSFRDCLFEDNTKIIGEHKSGKWHGNVKQILPSGKVGAFLFYRDDDIRYGVIYHDNGHYVGDLDSTGNRYGAGTDYFKNGDVVSFQNWHEDYKIGIYNYANGNKFIGRFDNLNNYINKVKLHQDFQLKLNNINLLSQSIQVDFNQENKSFLIEKNKYISINSSNENISNANEANSNNSNKTPYVKKEKNDNIRNLIIGILILIIFFISIFAKKNPQIKNVNNRTPDVQNSSIDKKDRYKELSLADSKKIFSYGVKSFMSKPEACKQLRLVYFKWMTASNNPNAFKKNLSKKNLNEIIKLRNKLKC
tara:strand:- start:1106 stop:2077 length:972 start_codon:yes stop_codon:yes gene_type:complete